ncbi:HlyD family secretion protein, partial [Pseudomonas fragariae (ex Marin et al. 2024)]
DAIRVPQEAITRDPAGRPQIVVIGQDKTSVRRTVELGPITDGQYIVTSGLAAGETVVVLGQDRVENAQPLETVPFSLAAPET